MTRQVFQHLFDLNKQSHNSANEGEEGYFQTESDLEGQRIISKTKTLQVLLVLAKRKRKM